MSKVSGCQKDELSGESIKVDYYYLVQFTNIMATTTPPAPTPTIPKTSNTPIIVYSDKNDILSAAALVPSRLLPSRPPLLVSSLDLHRSERCINPLLHSLVLVVVQIQNTCASIARISTNFAPKSFNVPKKNIALSKNSCK